MRSRSILLCLSNDCPPASLLALDECDVASFEAKKWLGIAASTRTSVMSPEISNSKLRERTHAALYRSASTGGDDAELVEVEQVERSMAGVDTYRARLR